MSADRPAMSDESRDSTAAASGGHTVVHLLPNDQARGAQRYARALVDQLGSRERNLVMTIFEGDSAGLGTDIALDVPDGRMRRFGFDPRVVTRLRRAVRHAGADLVVAHGGEPAKYAAFAFGEGMPLVYVNIGSTHPRLSRWHSRVLRDFYLRRCDAVVAVSEVVADQVVSTDGVSRDKVVVIPNGRDTRRYSPVARRRNEVPSLIWIGRLDKTKRPELFIDLASHLRRDGTPLRASIVGGGPRATEIGELAAEAGVDVLGERDDVAELLAASDMLVFTGRPPEGMPGVLIEAGLSGLAVVSTRVPGADEVIEHGATGLLVDIDDLDAMVEAVGTLIAQEDARREMGIAARARCVALFSLETTVDRWHELFSELLPS